MVDDAGAEGVWGLVPGAFGFAHGLDLMTPDIESLWKGTGAVQLGVDGLWWFNILANAVFFVVTIEVS